MAPIRPDQAPAAQMTVPQAIRPWSVRTPTTRSPAVSMPVTAVCVAMVTAGAGGGLRVSVDDQSRAAVAVGGRVRGGYEAVGADVGAQLLRFVGADHAARHAQAVLDGDVGLEGGGLLFAGEEEQVADGVELDVGAGAVREVLVGAQAAFAQFDVEGIGELGADAADRLARAAAAEVVAFDDDDVVHSRPRRGETRCSHPSRRPR